MANDSWESTARDVDVLIWPLSAGANNVAIYAVDPRGLPVFLGRGTAGWPRLG